MCFRKNKTKTPSQEEINEQVEMFEAIEKAKPTTTIPYEEYKKKFVDSKKNNIYEVGYKIKVVGTDNKVKTINKKVTIVAESDFEAVISFANGFHYEKGEVVYVRKVQMKDLRK